MTCFVLSGLVGVAFGHASWRDYPLVFDALSLLVVFTSVSIVFARDAILTAVKRRERDLAGRPLAASAAQGATDGADDADRRAAPDCPRCGAEMVRRTAGKGRSQGQQFWGCSKFPKCRGSTNDPESPDGTAAPRRAVGLRGKLAKAASKVVQTADKIERKGLESDEPDAAGRWDPEHRDKVLRYVYERDGGRCGLCAGEMKLKGAHVEHIVPKVFAVFDVRKGRRAEPGTRYKSRLHKLDNLQAAHTSCNKRKGNSPNVRDWRHPAMPPLPVADSADGTEFVLPWKPTGRSRRPGPASGMNIAMACVCGATATARAKRDTWRFGHAHRFCGTDEIAARRRRKARA